MAGLILGTGDKYGGFAHGMQEGCFPNPGCITFISLLAPKFVPSPPPSVNLPFLSAPHWSPTPPSSFDTKTDEKSVVESGRKGRT